MKNILLIGAGRSATVLIRYLLALCQEKGWKLRVGDLSEEVAAQKIGGHPHATTLRFDIHDQQIRESEIARADLVISMLPASFHEIVAKACLKHRRHLLTASYVPDQIRLMDAAVREHGLIFLMECGLDPGIDHMSGMKMIHQIRDAGGTLTGFETFAGGLLAPSEADNPWQYKFTWNPRNVVLAGTGGVKFIQENAYKYIPYHRLFRRTEVLHIPGHGYFEGYANRDSLKYLDLYGLRGIRTLFRGTLRRPGFCKAWDIFVQLGATDDSYEMEDVSSMTHRDFINAFLAYNPHDSVELKLAHYLQLEMEGEEMYKLRSLGLFEREPIGLMQGTPAQVLEHILKKNWTLNPVDRDMIVMLHLFDYLDAEQQVHRLQSHMVTLGEDAQHSGMAKTVGLPLGIAARMILEDRLDIRGVCLPTLPEIYRPILKELEAQGIHFVEQELPQPA